MNQPTADDGRLQAAVAAALLDSGRVLAHGGHVGALLALLGIVVTAQRGQDLAAIVFLASLGLWCVHCWLALRVAIDAALFRVLDADPACLAQFDQWLLDWGLRKRVTPRPLAERCRAALRIWRRQALSFALQAALVVAGALVLTASFY
ncbi:MAG: hypothetical protein U1F68_19290 [Gammaproteobacteria bacterium]